ncbi:MAG: hypothetical protein ACJA00_000034 [Myxococcota bacterium]|jgi:hypothetical protein
MHSADLAGERVIDICIAKSTAPPSAVWLGSPTGNATSAYCLVRRSTRFQFPQTPPSDVGMATYRLSLQPE